jgi:hypothetical protein
MKYCNFCICRDSKLELVVDVLFDVPTAPPFFAVAEVDPKDEANAAVILLPDD